MSLKTIILAAGAVAIGVAAYRYAQKECAAKKGEAGAEPDVATKGTEGIFDLFKKYTEPYMNYGGGKKIGFVNASGVPVATDEPNFVNSRVAFN